MTIQSLIKTALWVTFWSWLLTGGADAQCIHAPNSEGLAGGGFHLPTEGDLLVLGLTVLGVWGLSALAVAWIPSLSKNLDPTATLGNQVALNNMELTDLQNQTDEALLAMQVEYEDMIVERLNTNTEPLADLKETNLVTSK